jgi:hypothetical protein
MNTINSKLLSATIILLAFVFFFSEGLERALGQIEGLSLNQKSAESGKYHMFANLLENGDFEIDDDIDGFPNDWIKWEWIVEEELNLRKAILKYMDTAPDAIVRPRLTTRYPFFGKRSLNIISIDGATGPGVYTLKDFAPGIYTLSLYAKNPGEGKRKLGLFMASSGRLYEVGQRWRNIVYTERIPFHIREGEISLRDWSFSPGELLLDRVVLLKLPFDVMYANNLVIEDEYGSFTLDFFDIEKVNIPIGVNLEVRTPSGEVVRKNIEGLLEHPVDQLIFEINLPDAGVYLLKVELYDLRTADVIFTDKNIEIVRPEPDSLITKESSAEAVEPLSFFPIGIRLHGHELGDLEGMGFNSVLIREPTIEAISLYQNFIIRNNMKLFLEVVYETGAAGCDDDFRELMEATRWINGFSGWFVMGDYATGRVVSEGENDILRCLMERDDDSPVVLENYLPYDDNKNDTLSFGYVALDPNPVSIPSRPLYTIGSWADEISAIPGQSAGMIGMPQVFGGWPIAQRKPDYVEVRAMTYLAINHGANGIVYRDFSSLRPFFDQSDASWDIRKVPELWDRIPELNGELNSLSGYFLDGRFGGKKITFVPDGFIDCGIWSDGSSLLLIAVNVYDGEVEGKFLLGAENFRDKVEVLFEDRTHNIQGSMFEDIFQPFETHIYKLRLLEPA